MCELNKLKVGQVVEIATIDNDIYIGKIVEIDLEAQGIWVLLETYIEGMEEWNFPNTDFFYEIDIKNFRVLS